MGMRPWYKFSTGSRFITPKIRRFSRQRHAPNEIAFMVGYRDPGAFRKVFHRTTGGSRPEVIAGVSALASAKLAGRNAIAGFSVPSRIVLGDGEIADAQWGLPHKFIAFSRYARPIRD
jgi:hypothetical protein